MDFIVAEECFRLGLRAGAIVFRGVRVADSGPEQRADMERQVQASRGCFADVEAVRRAPEVAAFQELLRRVGVNPRRDQPSVERLLTAVVKRGSLPAINNLVDAYNVVSVRELCSLGAHDLDRSALPVMLRLLTGQETFTPLGRSQQVPVSAGEYGYVDARDRLLCRLDILQAEVSKVAADTVNALLIVEGTVVHSAERLRQVCVEVIEAVTRYCGGTAEVIAFPDFGVQE